MARMFAAALVFLVAISLSFADDTGPAMRTYCQNLLGISAQAENATNATSQPAAPPNPLNYNYSKQHYSARAALADSNASLENMRAAGLPYLRSRDLYLVAQQWFTGQAALELTGGQPNYQYVFDQAAEIKSVERQAFDTSDELSALASRFQSIAPDVNVTDAKAAEAQAKKEFADERFSESKRLINSAYDKISQAEAEATRSKALLESTRKTLEVFLQENWQVIVGIIAAMAIVLFVFQKQVRRFMLNARISALSAERGVLETMIKGLQKDYFESGKANELSYHIKTKKFGDMIRNINRQLPLLREELKKL